MSVTPFRQKRVGVFPRLRFQSESRLLSSLASLYPVNFSPEGEIGFDRMDAAVFFPDKKMVASRDFVHDLSSFFSRCSSQNRLCMRRQA